MNDICRSLVMWAPCGAHGIVFFWCVSKSCRRQEVGVSQLMVSLRCFKWQHHVDQGKLFLLFDFLFWHLAGPCWVSVHLDPDWASLFVASSEHKEHSEKKHRDKEKLRQSDGSSEKQRDKHRDKRRDEKVCARSCWPPSHLCKLTTLIWCRVPGWTLFYLQNHLCGPYYYGHFLFIAMIFWHLHATAAGLSAAQQQCWSPDPLHLLGTEILLEGSIRRWS